MLWAEFTPKSHHIAYYYKGKSQNLTNLINNAFWTFVPLCLKGFLSLSHFKKKLFEMLAKKMVEANLLIECWCKNKYPLGHFLL